MNTFDTALKEFIDNGGKVQTLDYKGPTESHRVIDGSTKGRFMRVTEQPVSKDHGVYQTRMSDVVDNILTSDD